LRLYNSLSKEIEEFVPFEPPLVRMYVCGPTVYDETHVGHGRTFVVFDSLKRYLVEKGYYVVHIQNITDIDDKIIKRAQEENKSWKTISDEYTSSYLEVLRKLDVYPIIHPRVTEHIRDIISLIELLISKGHAYVSNGNVYFDVSSYPYYGMLSRIPRESWRQEEEYLSEKRSPADFALWKKMKPGEPYWESPWGPGRPGWHIECSAMSSKYLGIKIDIHAGGMDLIFPHHENERAQSECAFGVSPWVKYWLHSGMVTIRGEKMSKSLGNIVLLKELLSKYKPETLRLWYLSAHYRAPIDFNEEIIAQYDRIRERLNDSFDQALKIIDAYRVEYSLDDGQLSLLRNLWESIRGYYLSLDNDFDTPNALKFVHEATSIFWKSVYTKESYAIALSYVLFMEKVNRVFRFRIAEKEKVTKLDEELIRVILDIRKKLREQKQYQLADEIRDKLKNLGIVIYDKGLESDFKLSR